MFVMQKDRSSALFFLTMYVAAPVCILIPCFQRKWSKDIRLTELMQVRIREFTEKKMKPPSP